MSSLDACRAKFRSSFSRIRPRWSRTSGQQEPGLLMGLELLVGEELENPLNVQAEANRSRSSTLDSMSSHQEELFDVTDLSAALTPLSTMESLIEEDNASDIGSELDTEASETSLYGSPFRFLDLPEEVKQIVYGNYFPTDLIVSVKRRSVTSAMVVSDTRKDYLPLILTCKAINRTALPFTSFTEAILDLTQYASSASQPVPILTLSSESSKLPFSKVILDHGQHYNIDDLTLMPSLRRVEICNHALWRGLISTVDPFQLVTNFDDSAAKVLVEYAIKASSEMENGLPARINTEFTFSCDTLLCVGKRELSVKQEKLVSGHFLYECA